MAFLKHKSIIKKKWFI